MKLAHLTATVAVALVLGLTATTAVAADGTLTFNGQVISSTCSINTGGSGGANYTVTLPTVQDSSLSSAGQTTGASAPFDIVLSGASCQNGDIYAVNFEPTGTTVDTATGALLNQATTGAATNAEVQLLDNNLNAVNAATNANAQQVTIVGNTGTFTYSAQYLAVGGAAGAGAVTASVEYSIVQL